MPEPSGTAAGVETLNLPRVSPLGTGKRSAFYGRPSSVRVGPAAIASIENGEIFPDGRVAAASGADDVADLILYTLPAGPTVCVGEFIAGPLNELLKINPQPIIGGVPLSARQTDVLARLGRLRNYVTVTSARRFHRVMAATQGRSSLPASSLREIADRLRAAKADSGGRIAILPVRQYERFCLTNRASLTAWLRARRFTILEPETTRLPELADQFAAASLVLLADPRQAGLLGLCHPGAQIIEIAPEGWLSAAAHYYCTVFGLDWRPFLAAPPSYPLRGALPFGSLVPCSYEISIRDLAGALDALAA
jgi:hypothetical protein